MVRMPRADDAINKTDGSMKPIVEFLKNTILGGLLVLLPLLLSWGLLAKAFDIIVKMATPLVRLLPSSILVEAPRLKELVAVVVLVTASFIFGMLLRAEAAAHFAGSGSLRMSFAAAIDMAPVAPTRSV